MRRWVSQSGLSGEAALPSTGLSIQCVVCDDTRCLCIARCSGGQLLSVEQRQSARGDSSDSIRYSSWWAFWRHRLPPGSMRASLGGLVSRVESSSEHRVRSSRVLRAAHSARLPIGVDQGHKMRVGAGPIRGLRTRRDFKAYEPVPDTYKRHWQAGFVVEFCIPLRKSAVN